MIAQECKAHAILDNARAALGFIIGPQKEEDKTTWPQSVRDNGSKPRIQRIKKTGKYLK
jgi:hypothetical protein